MKKTLLLISLLVSVLTFAQNNGITYQAVIYSTGGESIPGIHNSNSPLVNKPICLQFGIVDENTQIEYQEKVTVTTDDFGMVNLVIGNGTQIGGYASSFNAIDWSNSRKNLKVSLDESGSCSNFYEISNQVLTYVPYALAANSAATVSGVVSIAHGGTNSSTLIGAKTNLQLQNVDNTSDLNKPLSIATQTALSSKVDKVVGKDLSTNDYTTAEKTKLAEILGINTGDQDLSSYATTSALATKVDKVVGKELSTNDYTTVEKTKLAAISGVNTGDQDLSSYATITALTTKVDKVVGKDLSSNDYTTVEKTKLAGISGINTGDQDLSSYATSTDLGLKANSISPDFSGVPTAPTAVSGTNTTQLATTAFVSDAVTGKFVDITTNQAISGTKTFSSNIIANLSGNASTASNITGGTVGQLPYQTSSNTTSFLAANTSSTRKFLSSVGSSGSATVPSWQSLSTSDIVSSSSQTSGYLNFETGVFSAQNWTELNTQWTITSGWANTRDYNGTAYQGSYSIIAPDSQDFTLEGSKDFNLASLYIQRDMNGTATSVEFKGYNAAGNLVGTVTVATSSLNLFSYSNININFNGIRKLVFHPIGFDPNAMGGGSFFLDYFNVSILTSNNLNSVNGILKSDGNGNITAAVAGTDYLNSTSLSGYLPVTGGNITGTLGVGTTSNYANSKVHIAGNGLVVWGGTGTLLDASGNSHGYNENVALTVDGKAGSDILQLRNSAPSTLLVVDQNGKMGIGNTSPSEKLEVTGNVKASGKLTTGTITLPNTDGTSGQVLTTNGLGIVSWTTPSTISTSNFVNLTTDQTIAGNKAFSSELTINNTKFGRGSGSNTDNRNIGIGNFSLSSNASGSWNTAIGTYALQKNTDSWSNTAIGNEAISESIPGSNNTGVGSRSLMYTSGTGNTSVGTNALINSTTGNNNTAIGLNAFSTNTTGSNNTAIGSSTVVSSTGITNATAIGFGATVASNNTIQLGNTLVTNVNTYGSITANAAISDEITSDLTINTTNVEQYKGRVLICNPSNPITITFGSQLPKGFNCMILQKSIDANIINLAGETGVTIKNRNNYTSTAGNYAILTVVSIGGDIIVTAGDMQ